EAGEHVYIAMELVLGKSLAAMLAERPLSMAEALDLARQILRGIESAHEAGFIHRDLKPDNVLVTPEGTAKVLDFSLAKARERERSAEAVTQVTEEGRLLGTPGYMSPEQARGKEVDPRTDIFSFGIMFHEMLTGKRPFEGATNADVLTALLRDEPLPP